MLSAGKKSSNSSKKIWYPHARHLIRLVGNYPIIYLHPPKKRLTKLVKVKLDNAWKDVASKLYQSKRSCQMTWAKIKLRYAKLMILINTGQIEKEVAMSHPETCRYFNGLLSFLDPHISDITDDDISFRIHKSVNDLFGIKSKKTVKDSHKTNIPQCITHGQVKALLTKRQLRGDVVSINTEHVQAIVDRAVEHKLRELRNEIVTNSDENKVTMVTSKNTQNKDDNNSNTPINLGLESELIIENDIKREIDIMTEDEIKTEDVQMEDHIETEDDIKTEDEDYLKDEYLLYGNVPVIHDTKTDTEENSEDMTDNAPPATDEYIKKFFSELGVVMSMELSIDKQKILMSRINALLKGLVFEEGQMNFITEIQ